MKKRIFLLLAATLAVLLAAAAFFAWRYFADRRLGAFRDRVELFIRPDTPPDAVLDTLLAHARRPGSVLRMWRREQVADRMEAGHYTLIPSNSGAYSARMLSHGWQSPVRLVLSGTMRLRGRLASKIAAQMMMDSATVADALLDSGLLARYGFTPENEFALFVPDSYQMYWTDGMEQVLDRQKAAYDAFWTSARRDSAAALGLTPMEVSILASIVSGESRYRPELPKIAGVYLNRLRRGMKLQADPTVAFCFDYEPTRILRRHLEVDSPYNTYRNAGLPPAPICVPAREYLEAVLRPDPHDYLFFCASPDFDGSHRFARTLAEHNLNARAFQQALTARQRAAAKK